MEKIAVNNRLSTSYLIRLSYKFKVQITRAPLLKGLTIHAYKSRTNTLYITYLDKAKSKSITLSKYKSRLISNLEKYKLATRDESLTSYYYSLKINNNNSRDELLTSRNPYTIYNKLETSLELYNPAYFFLTNEENKKDSNSLDNPIILNNN
ncbi:hypothetical protein BGZ57DRAFT_1009155 [Hyaloscypha finlandica]|nr:hypothetical protein BGZ57DRAFT_1009155 [Hyaloscypha finlandica]